MMMHEISEEKEPSSSLYEYSSISPWRQQDSQAAARPMYPSAASDPQHATVLLPFGKLLNHRRQIINQLHMKSTLAHDVRKNSKITRLVKKVVFF